MPVTSIVDAGQHTLDVGAKLLLVQLGTGFDTFKLDEDLHRVLHLVCDVVVALGHHVRGTDDPPRLSDIVLQRNAVQNQLLWLNPCSASLLRGDTINNTTVITVTITIT
ncbi:hypothetical protein AYL99_02375 [Fonsecaea erecta]|uniref:Uncharacterized protein n=1 Tax=Fonsecaea erecta TaxID=1367422 RepID=A0A178ZTP6_9EURO|nr:hypothetical protein AYL99_02375 [Fonsecaea erecta]OAP63148.1 hypothetical protein AYL99_02375 [Fonsecaea erecta]